MNARPGPEVAARRPPTPLQLQLAERMRAHGPLPFAAFMRECLYHPEFGYYSRPEARHFGDYYTSVDVHPIFGRLLARQLAEMWHALDFPTRFLVVETGAGTGGLAAQVLDFAVRALPDFYQALRYVAVEQSPARRHAHAERLEAHVSRGRAISAAELPREIPEGCILSNELFDALPVHRVLCKKGALHEMFVGLRASGAGHDLVEGFPGSAMRSAELEERPGPLSSSEIEEYFLEQGITLREGQFAEAGLEVCRWFLDAGRRLGRGFVLTIDYGYEARELYGERHLRGTLLAYSRHRVSENFLDAPGEQDLTAHVNFTALDVWGGREGLARTGCVSQMAFLVGLGRANEFADLYASDASEVEKIRARLLLKTLLHPEGMGGTFQVCVHHKGISAPRLTGLQGI